jgi:hypothetical protein
MKPFLTSIEYVECNEGVSKQACLRKQLVRILDPVVNIGHFIESDSVKVSLVGVLLSKKRV